MTSRLDDQLRGSVAAARVDAPPRLRARTAAAIAGLTPDVGVAPVRDLTGPHAYAPAVAMLVVAAAIAVAGSAPRGERGAAADTATPRLVPIVVEVDPTRYVAAFERRARALDAPFERALVAQARMLAADASEVADAVLARLPMRPLRVRKPRS